MTQPLYETYRPRTFADVVGQDKAVAQIDLIRRRRGSLSGAAYWISGQSGTGKTTLARIIAAEVASDWAIVEIDSQSATPQLIAQIEAGSHLMAMGKGGRAYIINEAHGLSRAAILKFLTVIERIPKHVAWLFTTTVDGMEAFTDKDDSAMFLSRCQRIPLARRDITRPMAERCRMIAQREGLDGLPIERYIRLLQDCRNNMRAALQSIESGEMIATDPIPTATEGN